MRKFTFLMQLIASIAFTAAIFDPEVAAWLFGTGLSLAATPVAGGTMTYGGIETENPEYFEEDISKMITKIEPSRYPFDNLLRHLGNDKPAHNMKIQFEEDGYFKRDGSITARAGAGASSVLTMPATDNFNVDDICVIPTVEITVEGKVRDLQVKVTDKTSTTITVVPVGKTNWASPANVAIPEFATTEPVAIYRISNTKTETSAQTTPKAILPDREWNYAQIQMAQLEESILSGKMRAKSGHQKFNANNIHSLLNFRSECEYAAKFGIRDTGVDGGDQWWSMAGFDKFVTKTIGYDIGGMTNATWVDWTRQAFSDVRGSEQRHLLCEQFLLADILKVDEVQRQLQGKSVEVVRGIRCRRIETDFGTILLTFDRSLQEVGKKHYGMLIDPAHVQRRVVEPMHTEQLELNKSGNRRVKALRMIETYSLEVRVPDSHAIFKGTPAQG